MSDSVHDPNPTQVTQLLARAGDGVSDAMSDVFPLVYEELRRLAGVIFARQNADHTLQPTALVNEAFIRLVGHGDVDFKSRAHFFAVSAMAMRQILTDHARRKHAAKRSGDARAVTLVDAPVAGQSSAIDLLALDDAMSKLALLDERKHRLVELRFFGGLTNEQAATVLGVARSTVADDWTVARAWLQAELTRN